MTIFNSKFFRYAGSFICAGMFVITAFCATPNNFHRVSLYGGNLTMDIPSNFYPLEGGDPASKFAELDTKQKFSNWDKPKYVFTDKNHNNIIVDLIKTQSTLTDYLNGLEQYIKQENPHAIVSEKTSLTLNGHKFLMITVKSPMPDSSVLHNCTLVTSVQKKQLQILIFLNENDYKNANEVIQKIVESIKIKDI